MGNGVIQFVNYTLSFLMWMIIGRTFLKLIVGDRPNLILLAFVKVTEPVFSLTRKVLPFAGPGWIPVLSFFLLAALRVALIVVFQPATGR